MVDTLESLRAAVDDLESAIAKTGYNCADRHGVAEQASGSGFVAQLWDIAARGYLHIQAVRDLLASNAESAAESANGDLLGLVGRLRIEAASGEMGDARLAVPEFSAEFQELDLFLRAYGFDASLRVRAPRTHDYVDELLSWARETNAAVVHMPAVLAGLTSSAQSDFSGLAGQVACLIRRLLSLFAIVHHYRGLRGMQGDRLHAALSGQASALQGAVWRVALASLPVEEAWEHIYRDHCRQRELQMS